MDDLSMTEDVISSLEAANTLVLLFHTESVSQTELVLKFLLYAHDWLPNAKIQK